MSRRQAGVVLLIAGYAISTWSDAAKVQSGCAVLIFMGFLYIFIAEYGPPERQPSERQVNDETKKDDNTKA